jgi:hypothetical protein
MVIDSDTLLDEVRTRGDEWQSWRARRIAGEDPGEVPTVPGQDALGAFAGPTGEPSPGATGARLCHLKVIGLAGSGPGVIAADWLQDARTPAEAWLDPPTQVPGELDTPAAGRVWATAAASCGLLAVGRDPGHRALDLLRGEADQEGRFTGGPYPTFAAAGAYWLATGPKTEMAEWALRWARENVAEWWGTETWLSGLTFWAAAGVPAEHATVEFFLDELRDASPAGDLESPLATLELLGYYGA